MEFTFSSFYLRSGLIQREITADIDAPSAQQLAPYRDALRVLRQGDESVQLVAAGKPGIVLDVGLGDPRETATKRRGLNDPNVFQFLRGRVFWLGYHGQDPGVLCLVLAERSRDQDLDTDAASWLVITSAAVRGRDVTHEQAEPTIARILRARPALAFTFLPGMPELDLKEKPHFGHPVTAVVEWMAMVILGEDAQRP